MIRKFKIGDLSITFVFRHRWEKVKHSFQYHGMWPKYELGAWYRKSKCVGKQNFSDVTKWGDNLRNSHMIGLELIACRMWVDISRGVMDLEINTEN